MTAMENHILPNLSLVTFTYNDHAFVHELLSHVNNFSIPFQGIMVIDDASTEPFEPLPHQSGVTVIRLPQHRGIPHAKKFGFSTIEGSVILSLDADMRPHKNWLMSSLPLLADPAVGLVGATCVHNRGLGYLGTALAKTPRPNKEIQEAHFAGGGCWLFRKETWNSVGGLDDLPDNAFEDVFFCRKLLNKGYRILLNDRYPVYDTRNLHRVSYCKREVRYYAPSIAIIITKFGPERFMADSEKDLEIALHYFKDTGDPILCYTHVLKMCLLFYSLQSEQAISASRIEPSVPASHILAQYPRAQKLLRGDMNRAHRQLGEPHFFLPQGFTGHLTVLEEVGAIQALEQVWAARYLEEDGTNQYDWHYTQNLV